MSEFTIQDRMVCNLTDARSSAVGFAQEIKDMLKDEDIVRLMSEDDRSEIKKMAEAFEKSLNEKLNVVVAGSFKRGKSTFINALLGEYIVPTNVTPETMTINKIIYGDENGAEAVLKNGKRLRLYDDELTRERLEQIVKEVPAPIDYIEVRRNIPLLKELSFTDTPGLGDAEDDFRQEVMAAMLRADIVIYVIDAAAPLSAEEAYFLNSVVFPQNFSKMFIIINKIDTIVKEEDARRVEERISKQVYALNSNASVFSVSSLREYCRKTQTDCPIEGLSDYSDNSFKMFETALANDVIMQKDVVKSESIANAKARIAEVFKAKCSKILHLMELNEQELNEKEQKLLEDKVNMDVVLAKTKNSISSFILSKKKEARVWMDGFMRRMESELSSLDDSVKGQELQKHLYFYISDKVKEAFTLCVEEHTEQMQKSLAEEIESLTDKTFSDKDVYGGINIEIKDISWNAVSGALYFGNVIATELLDMGGLSTITYAIGGFLRQRKINKDKGSIVKPLLEDFGALSKQIFAQLESLYDSYAQNAQQSVESYFRSSIDTALNTVAQAKSVNAEFGERKEEAKAIILKCSSKLDELMSD